MFGKKRYLIGITLFVVLLVASCTNEREEVVNRFITAIYK